MFVCNSIKSLNCLRKSTVEMNCNTISSFISVAIDDTTACEFNIERGPLKQNASKKGFMIFWLTYTYEFYIFISNIPK